jgi:hypothetical protein
MTSSKMDLQQDFAAGVYQSLMTGDTVSHVGFFYPTVCTVALLTFSLVQLPLPLPV